MKALVFAVAALTSFSLCADAWFDCGYAGNAMEIVQCRTMLVDGAEEEMEKYINKVKEKATAKSGMMALLDKSQADWLSYRETHCSSIGEMWSGGTMRGLMILDCWYRITKQRTHIVWQDYLCVESCSLPEPKFNQDQSSHSSQSDSAHYWEKNERRDLRSAGKSEIWTYGDWYVELLEQNRGVLSGVDGDYNSIFQVAYAKGHCDDVVFLLFAPRSPKYIEKRPIASRMLVRIDDAQESMMMSSMPNQESDVGFMVFKLQPSVSVVNKLRRGNQMTFLLKNNVDDELASSVLLKSATFSLKGFVAAELKAQEQCKFLSGN